MVYSQEEEDNSDREGKGTHIRPKYKGAKKNKMNEIFLNSIINRATFN